MSDGLRELAVHGEFLRDVEALRIANGNRIFALTNPDGKIRLSEDHPVVASAMKAGELLAAAEHLTELDLRKTLRRASFYPWIKGTVGLGEKQVARLLAVIGDPRHRYDNDQESPTFGEWLPRTVGQLWSYCGYAVSADGTAPKRKRGEQAAYNTEARTRCFLIAESCVKQRTSPYRVVYDEGRAKYADAVHAQPCARCGPKGKPALPGSPLSDGHKHARALRLVAKAVLKDLWLAAGDHGRAETQPSSVPSQGGDQARSETQSLTVAA